MPLIEQFAYRPLESVEHTRLLQISSNLEDGLISCTITHHDLPTHYRCLSYMWGSEASANNIRLNGKSFSVRDNLWQFLHRAREFCPNQPLWIDALCINQEDIPEKNYQVQQMSKLYAGASEVLMWLGQDPKLDIAFNTANELAEASQALGVEDERILYSRRKESGPLKTKVLDAKHAIITRTFLLDPDAFLDSFESLILNDYYTRAWISQEVILAKSPLLLTGHRAMHLYFFYRQFTVPGTDPGRLYTLPDRIVDLLQHTNMAHLIISWHARFTGNDIPSLREALEDFHKLGCSDVRDRIYSRLGLISGGAQFKVDYNEDCQSLFWRAADHFLRHSRDDTLEVASFDHLRRLMMALQLNVKDLRAGLKRGDPAVVYHLGDVRRLDPTQTLPDSADFWNGAQMSCEPMPAKSLTDSDQVSPISEQRAFVIACTSHSWDNPHAHLCFRPSADGVYQAAAVIEEHRDLFEQAVLYRATDGGLTEVKVEQFTPFRHAGTDLAEPPAWIYAVQISREAVLWILEHSLPLDGDAERNLHSRETDIDAVVRRFRRAGQELLEKHRNETT
ncbi:uncharacterized protein HMPREF1541_09701 [Cyphellophora europaea CBS 101466]|uniref:Heterokaryon incompatibility domain-containing protein n=1 Tax=Cyphellophora europaea (strain CBS 101466) TaxID=1220924 RepID=W2S7Z8_CYPE1|nr:uncharacterized protein HMPREF1541_09701 [Cyphellophora europaea CBS 101466]ETN44826.1 hypothetical protein HMPREF1541_09701 [Cyphellophora europaea CBS 101466]